MTRCPYLSGTAQNFDVIKYDGNDALHSGSFCLFYWSKFSVLDGVGDLVCDTECVA